MSRRPFRLSPDERPFLEITGLGRSGPPGATRFSPAQIEQIRRTVRMTPEVMVKVTGGGTNTGAVAAHFGYLASSREALRGRQTPDVDAPVR